MSGRVYYNSRRGARSGWGGGVRSASGGWESRSECVESEINQCCPMAGCREVQDGEGKKRKKKRVREVYFCFISSVS